MAEKDLITRDMTIGDITEQHPKVAEIFMEYGLHCVGCHVAYWETIEEGARGHGMDEETIDCMIRDANTVANETESKDQSQTPKIQLTSAAIARVKEMIKEENKIGHVFRIAVDADAYKFTLEQEPKEDDEFISQDELLIVIDKKSLDKLSGYTVDYVEKLGKFDFSVFQS